MEKCEGHTNRHVVNTQWYWISVFHRMLNLSNVLNFHYIIDEHCGFFIKCFGAPKLLKSANVKSTILTIVTSSPETVTSGLLIINKSENEMVDKLYQIVCTEHAP